MDYSLTIRPTLVKFEELRVGKPGYSALEKWIAQNCSRFLISLEKDNHYQIGMTVKGSMRKDSIKRALLTILKKFISLDEVECKIALMLKNHRDWKGLVGYCAKENDPIIRYGITDDELADSIIYYSKLVHEKQFKMDRFKVKNNNIGVLFEKYYEANKKKYVLETCDERVVCCLADMDYEGYYISNILVGRNLYTTIKYLSAKIRGPSAVRVFIRNQCGGEYDDVEFHVLK